MLTCHFLQQHFLSPSQKYSKFLGINGKSSCKAAHQKGLCGNELIKNILIYSLTSICVSNDVIIYLKNLENFLMRKFLLSASMHSRIQMQLFV